MALPTLKTLRPGELTARAAGSDTDHSVSGRLDRFAGDDVLMLHRRSAGNAGEIDHLAIGPSGVFVICARHCPGGSVQVRTRGGLFTPARDRLLVRGRDRSVLVRLLVQQRSAVADVLAEAGVPVLAVLCAVGAQLPWNRVPVVDGVTVRGVVDTCLMVRASGPYDPDARLALRDALAAAFPAPAT